VLVGLVDMNPEPKRFAFIDVQNTETEQKIPMGISWKCNCDVEMAVDVLEHVGPDTELLFFTGDGDFEFLIHKAIERGSKIILVSSAKLQVIVSRRSSSRLSTKLRKLTETTGTPYGFWN